MVQEITGETLIYDLRTHQAHCLNATAAWIWRSCDGHTPIGVLAERFAATHPAQAIAAGVRTQELLQLGVQQLQKADLLEFAEAGAMAEKISRRELARRVEAAGGLALLIPTVSSIIAPTVAAAASNCIPDNTPCVGSSSSTPCCSGLPCNMLKQNKC